MGNGRLERAANSISSAVGAGSFEGTKTGDAGGGGVGLGQGLRGSVALSQNAVPTPASVTAIRITREVGFI